MTTEAEREAQIRHAMSFMDEEDCRFLLRLLDEARAEIAGLREALAAHQDELGITGLTEQAAGAKERIAELVSANEKAFEQNAEQQREIARLTAKPGASALERANAWYQYWERSTARTADNIVWLARQIEQAEADGISRGVQRASARIEQAEREARAAAIEEAAMCADTRAKQLRARSNFDQWEAGGTTASEMIASAIRALAAPPVEEPS